MSTITSTDSIDDFIDDNNLNTDLAAAQLDAHDYIGTHFFEIDFLNPVSTFVPGQPDTNTFVSGDDPSASGHIDVTGKGFVGNIGDNHTGSSGTITGVLFEGDDGGHMVANGSLKWTASESGSSGVSGGSLTSFEARTPSGEWFSAEGKFTVVADSVHDELIVTGTSTHERTMTAGGITVDMTGSIKILDAAGDVSGTVKTVEFGGDTNHSGGLDASDQNVTITGSFEINALNAVINGADTVDDILSNQIFYTGNDTFTVIDGDRAWHGFAGNDTITGGNSSDDNLNGDDGNDILLGLAGEDSLDGGIGNDTLDGGEGDDSMTGGTGDDTYLVDSDDDTIIENASAGTDTVKSTADGYTLADNVENLILLGSGPISGAGNDGANTITGNAGDNSIDGGGGADTMIGGAGDDTYFVDNAGDTVTDSKGDFDSVFSSVSFVLGKGLESLTLTDHGNINGTGNTSDNNVIGNDGDNTLTGGSGDDFLEGGGGSDVMIGGSGNDTYYLDDLNGTIVETAKGGTDTVVSAFSFSLTDPNLENVTLTGSDDVNATGNAANNVLTGNTGMDTLTGGLGDDTYIVHSSTTVVVENAGEGKDSVQADVSFDLSTNGLNVENLTLTGSNAIDGTGNDLVNTIIGNSGGNILNGMGGADIMTGGLGDDTYIVDDVKDKLTEGKNAGYDIVHTTVSWTLGSNFEELDLDGHGNINGTGNSAGNALLGNDGDNTLNGGSGDDFINGDLGTNILTGGSGADIFYFAPGHLGNDTVTDFKASQGDVLDISSLLTGYDDGVSNPDDFVHFTTVGKDTVVSIDADGTANGVSFENILTLKGVTGLNVDDLVDSHNLLVVSPV